MRSRIFEDAWRTEEGRQRLCGAMTQPIRAALEQHRILSQLEHQLAEPHELREDEIVTHQTVLSAHEIRMARDPSGIIQYAMQQIQDAVIQHDLDTYWTQLGAAIEEEPMPVAECAFEGEGRLLFRASQRPNIEWVFDHLMGLGVLIPEGLPWEEPLWTRHMGVKIEMPVTLQTLSRPWDMTTALVAVHGVRYTFPSPVYRVEF